MIKLTSMLLILAFVLPAAVIGSHPPRQDGHRSIVKHRQPTSRRYARTLDLNVGVPRTVRTIYFLPTDRVYEAEKVERIETVIRQVQKVIAEQMRSYDYGDRTFRYETDADGNPMVHRVDGDHPESHYETNMYDLVLDEIGPVYNLEANVYIIVVDNSREMVGDALGYGSRWSKVGGVAMVPQSVEWFVLAYELGHAWGLEHDFRDGTYLMSYGPGEERLSECSSRFLSVHPYFDDAISVEDGEPPTLKLVSPRRYPSGASSVSIDVEVSDSDGLYQALLFVGAGLAFELKTCLGFMGEQAATVSFDYDGVLPSEIAWGTGLGTVQSHPMAVEVVDTEGNSEWLVFALAETSPHYVAALDSGARESSAVAFSPDGGTLASGTRRGSVELWDVRARGLIDTFDGHTDVVSGVSFAPGGKTLATVSWDESAKLWDIATGNNTVTLINDSYSLAYSPDGKTLAFALWGSNVELWDTASAATIDMLEGHTEVVSAVAFSHDLLASGSWDGTVKLWEVESLTEIGTLEPEDSDWGQAPIINSLALSYDGRTLATGLEEGMIQIWDVSNQAWLHTLYGHTDSVTQVVFSPDGKVLASGAMDGTVILWNAAIGTVIATFGHTAAVNTIDYSPDGKRLASGTADGVVELWDTSWLSGHEPPQPPDYPPVDVNADGVVDISDLEMIAAAIGEQGIGWREDVNGDEVVDILDMVMVANAINAKAATP